MVDFPGYSLSGAAASFLFVLLSMKRADDFSATGPARPVLARVGEEALLTCRLLPARPAAHMDVSWYRAGPGAQVLLARWDGAAAAEAQPPEPRGRVQWVADGLARGAAALRLRDVRPADDGQYWCRFQEGSRRVEASVLLRVACLGSAPHIHMEGSVEGEIQLVCTADRWFPEPQVYWKDAAGEKLLTLSEYHIQDEGGLFHVEATLVVRDASAGTVSCLIHSPLLAKEMESVFSIPEKLQSELASLKVIGPSQPLLVRVGEDIQLTCSLSPKANARSMEVRWVRSHRYPAVYVYMAGEHLSAEQMAEYRGRTVLGTDAIGEGRLTLRIHGARTSDDGQYRCLFEKDGVYQENSWDLKVVGLGSSPRITLEGLSGGEMRLTCSSEGWFPQPRVQWTDTEGKTVPSLSEVLTQDSHELFQVEAFLLVTNSSALNVTCSISNPLLGEEKSATFSLSDSRMTFSWKMLLILGLILLVAVGLVKWKSCSKVNVALDPNTAGPELTLSERMRRGAHGQSCNQMSHRDLTARSTLWARRGSRQGGGAGR